MLGHCQSLFVAKLNMLMIPALLLAVFIITYHYVNKLNAVGFYEMMNVAFDFGQSVFIKAIDGGVFQDIWRLQLPLSLFGLNTLLFFYIYIYLYFFSS